MDPQQLAKHELAKLLRRNARRAKVLYTTHVLRLWLRGDEVGLDVVHRAQGGDASAAEALAAELLDLADELEE